jgi:hypothetical protein
MTILDTLDVHVGVRGPSHWDELAALRRVTAIDADDDGDRPVVTLPDIDWAGLGFTPRWIGDDASESVAAVEPSFHFGEGADEWRRFIAGTSRRGELALAVSMIGSATPPTYIAALGPPGETVTMPSEYGHVVTGVFGQRITLASPPAPPRDLGSADLEVARQIANIRRDLPWWHLKLWVQNVARGGGPYEAKPDGTLSPLLLSQAGEVVAGVWTSPKRSLRYYVLPYLPSYVPILRWLADRAIPELVPTATRRLRASVAFEPKLQTEVECATQSALYELATDFERRAAVLEVQLDAAREAANAVRYPLLFGSGSVLVAAVERVLLDAGLEVVNLDDHFGDTVSADLLVTWGNQRVLVEVKSSASHPSERDAERATRHLNTWPNLKPELPVSGIVLIFNHQTRLHPLDRSAEPYTRPEFVASLTFPVVTTLRLFDAWRKGDDAAIRQAMFR